MGNTTSTMHLNMDICSVVWFWGMIFGRTGVQPQKADAYFLTVNLKILTAYPHIYTVQYFLHHISLVCYPTWSPKATCQSRVTKITAILRSRCSSITIRATWPDFDSR
jgi:hypothetical protein